MANSLGSRLSFPKRFGRSLKVMIAYPPVPSDKGVPLLSQNRQFQYFKNPTFIYPVIPAYAATLLQARGHEVVWSDFIALQKTPEEFMAHFEAEKPDLVALEVKTPVVKTYWKYIDRMKALRPETICVLMGDHVTALPLESFSRSRVDVVLAGGDFDYALSNLAGHLTGSVDLEGGVYFRDASGEVVSTGPFASHEVEGLPLIDRELTQWKLYAYKNGNYKYRPGTYTMIGRDCWWRKDGGCTFCSWTTTFKKFRVGTPGKLLDEVGFLIERYGIREIFDDTGTFPVGAWLREFCRGMVDRGYNRHVKLGCNMRPGALTQEDYDLMGEAGFRLILYGLESASLDTLNRINKGQQYGDAAESVRMAKRAGLEPHVTCMVGYPWESREEARRSIELTRELFDRGWIDSLQATIVIPYPGTRLFEECEANGWLQTDDWDRYDMRGPVMVSPVSNEEILELVQSLYKSFLTPRFVLRKALSVRNFDDIRFLWRAGKAVMGHLVDFGARKPDSSVNI